ncbi:hypothetical protein ACOME3_003414 [Neoechinorhynchus agilis]
MAQDIGRNIWRDTIENAGDITSAGRRTDTFLEKQRETNIMGGSKRHPCYGTCKQNCEHLNKKHLNRTEYLDEWINCLLTCFEDCIYYDKMQVSQRSKRSLQAKNSRRGFTENILSGISRTYDSQSNLQYISPLERDLGYVFEYNRKRLMNCNSKCEAKCHAFVFGDLIGCSNPCVIACMRITRKKICQPHCENAKATKNDLSESLEKKRMNLKLLGHLKHYPRGKQMHTFKKCKDQCRKKCLWSPNENLIHCSRPCIKQCIANYKDRGKSVEKIFGSNQVTKNGKSEDVQRGPFITSLETINKQGDYNQCETECDRDCEIKKDSDKSVDLPICMKSCKEKCNSEDINTLANKEEPARSIFKGEGTIEEDKVDEEHSTPSTAASEQINQDGNSNQCETECNRDCEFKKDSDKSVEDMKTLANNEEPARSIFKGEGALEEDKVDEEQSTPSTAASEQIKQDGNSNQCETECNRDCEFKKDSDKSVDLSICMKSCKEKCNSEDINTLANNEEPARKDKVDEEQSTKSTAATEQINQYVNHNQCETECDRDCKTKKDSDESFDLPICMKSCKEKCNSEDMKTLANNEEPARRTIEEDKVDEEHSTPSTAASEQINQDGNSNQCETECNRDCEFKKDSDKSVYLSICMKSCKEKCNSEHINTLANNEEPARSIFKGEGALEEDKVDEQQSTPSTAATEQINQYVNHNQCETECDRHCKTKKDSDRSFDLPICMKSCKEKCNSEDMNTLANNEEPARSTFKGEGTIEEDIVDEEQSTPSTAASEQINQEGNNNQCETECNRDCEFEKDSDKSVDLSICMKSCKEKCNSEDINTLANNEEPARSIFKGEGALEEDKVDEEQSTPSTAATEQINQYVNHNQCETECDRDCKTKKDSDRSFDLPICMKSCKEKCNSEDMNTLANNEEPARSTFKGEGTIEEDKVDEEQSTKSTAATEQINQYVNHNQCETECDRDCKTKKDSDRSFDLSQCRKACKGMCIDKHGHPVDHWVLKLRFKNGHVAKIDDDNEEHQSDSLRFKLNWSDIVKLFSGRS